MDNKRFKKGAVAAVAFAACLNLNGCVYGPAPYPGDEAQPSSDISETRMADDTEEEKPLAAIADSAKLEFGI